MRYEVWKWTADDVSSYDDQYGLGSFVEDLEKSGTYYALTQYGNLAGESDSEDDAMTISMRAADELDVYGTVSIYDREEKQFFN